MSNTNNDISHMSLIMRKTLEGSAQSSDTSEHMESPPSRGAFGTGLPSASEGSIP